MKSKDGRNWTICVTSYTDDLLSRAFVSRFHQLFVIFVNQVFPGEPVYAQVNRDKKKNSRNHHHMEPPGVDVLQPGGYHHHDNYSEHADLWQPTALPRGVGAQHGAAPDNAAGGDSWVWLKEKKLFIIT